MFPWLNVNKERILYSLMKVPKTHVYDSYWRFAAERLAVYYRRLQDPKGPWTNDPILSAFRFTNAFRASDRVSQYLIREVQYGSGRSQSADELFFRTVLFKVFNRVDTWELIEKSLGSAVWSLEYINKLDVLLTKHFAAGNRIYSPAYIVPAPPFGKARKHSNHLALIAKMMADGLPGKLQRAPTLERAYNLLCAYPGLGKFLAYQYAIDLNYSVLTNFDEDDFVVAGPGAMDGISKCFVNGVSMDPAKVIFAMVEHQDDEFQRLGLKFSGLFGRPLKAIDCQNVFCEISKYLRVANPDVLGISGRTKIKQRYDRAGASDVPAPTFPPKWGIGEEMIRVCQASDFSTATSRGYSSDSAIAVQ